MDPSTAKKSIVDLVERSTAAVGGDWKVYRGPAVEPCGQDVEDRVRYVYIVEREGSATELQRDVDAVRAVWKDAGMDVVDTATAGGATRAGIRGTGDPVTSIGFDAKPTGTACPESASARPGTRRSSATRSSRTRAERIQSSDR